MSDSRPFLRHTLATIAYRGGKAIRDAGPSLPSMVRRKFAHSGENFAHMGDLMDWALAMADGRREWHDSAPLAWGQECERFFDRLKNFDDYLASDKPLELSRRKIVSRPDRRHVHAHWPARDVAANGRHSHRKGKIISWPKSPWTSWRGSGAPRADGIQILRGVS